MSPISDVYDHLTTNTYQKSKNMIKNDSNGVSSSDITSNDENLQTISKRKSILSDEQEQSKRRLSVTKASIPETIIRCSVSNQAYEKPLIGKVLTNENKSHQQQTNVKSYRLPNSSARVEVKAMDFRPLIVNGRRKLNGRASTSLSSSSSMIIIKKKSPSPINNISFNQVFFFIHLN